MLVTKPTLVACFMVMLTLARCVGLATPTAGLIMLMAAVIGFGFIIRPQFPPYAKLIMIAFLAHFVIYMMLTVADPSGRGIQNTIYIAASALIFLYFVSNAPKFAQTPGPARALLIGAIVLIMLGTVSGDTANKNTVSGMAIYLLLTSGALSLASGRISLNRSILYFVGVCATGLLLEHRTMTGVAVLAMGMLLLLRYAPTWFSRTIVLVSTAGLSIVLVGLYAQLWGLDINDLNELSVEYSGRPAVSGRQLIWPVIIMFTAQSPIIGLGTGVIFSDLYNVHWSAHNYFLQTYMQTGFLGLAGMVFLMLSLFWAIGRPRRDDPLRIYMTCVFIVLLIHMSLEVFLMQVGIQIGAMAWMSCGIGIGLIRSRETWQQAARPDPPPVLGQ